MALEYFQGTGRRKRASARVRLYPGNGKIVVNDRPFEDYFPRIGDQRKVLAPLEVAGVRNTFNVSVHVAGGGISGQAEATAMGIARALIHRDTEVPGSQPLRPILRKGGFLTRDAREKERKKPGLKRARKAPQYTKR
ncbi:MAG: 30S ribosomal protein S9 [Caldilineales bacterium]|nr:30S ribosomal protein S9 [Caldilineales bacterium]MDW8316252.1 30S ribosomal protein S9 [Anaerolineae bacterium]